MSKPGMIESLRERAKGHVRKSGPSCQVCALPAETRAAVAQLHSEGLSYAAIAAALQEDGIKVKTDRYSTHFREHEQG